MLSQIEIANIPDNFLKGQFHIYETNKLKLLTSVV